MNLGTELAQLRQKRELSVYRLSKLTEISENHIHRIEAGESQPSVATLERLLVALDSNLAEFFNHDRNVLYPTELEREVISEIRRLNPVQAETLLNFLRTIE